MLTSLGVEPNPPGAFAQYTLPTIYDPRTRTTVMDSVKIVAYLDETYPDTPAMFTPPTRTFIHAFQTALFSNVQEHLSLLLAQSIVAKLNAPSQTYLRLKLEAIFGCKVEEILTPEQRAERWSNLEKGFSVVASWLELTGDGRLLLMGGDGADDGNSLLCHADTSIAGMLIYARAGFGEESEEWQRIESLDGGRWKRFLNYFAKWVDTSR